MNKVTKLYENAGVEKEIVCYEPFELCSKDWECSSCIHGKAYYPFFTAEKQIEIIKLLAKWKITIERLLDTWYFSTDGIIGIFKLKGDFEEALANYINLVWQSLTEEERKQVIEECKKRSSKCERCKASEDYQPTDCLDNCSNDVVKIFADDILRLFDIEEINK